MMLGIKQFKHVLRVPLVTHMHHFVCKSQVKMSSTHTHTHGITFHIMPSEMRFSHGLKRKSNFTTDEIRMIKETEARKWTIFSEQNAGL